MQPRLKLGGLGNPGSDGRTYDTWGAFGMWKKMIGTMLLSSSLLVSVANTTGHTPVEFCSSVAVTHVLEVTDESVYVWAMSPGGIVVTVDVIEASTGARLPVVGPPEFCDWSVVAPSSEPLTEFEATLEDIVVVLPFRLTIPEEPKDIECVPDTKASPATSVVEATMISPLLATAVRSDPSTKV